MFLFYDNVTGVVTSYDTHSDALDAVVDRLCGGDCVIINTETQKFWTYDEEDQLVEAGIIHNKS